MPKTKTQKTKIIEDLKEKLKKQKSTVFIDFSGLDSRFLSKMREELKQSDCALKIVKKTLFRKGLESLGMEGIAGEVDKIKFQLALIFSFKDEIVPAKICHKFSQENEKLKILGGIFNKEIINKEKVIELAQLPSKEELLARLAGSLQGPVSGFINVLKGSLNGLINILGNIKPRSENLTTSSN